MKQILFLLLISFGYNFTFSQNTKGKITYKATLNTEGFQKAIKDSVMPEFRKNDRLKSATNAVPCNFNLFFNGKEALYKPEYDMATNRRLGLLLNYTGLVGRQDYIYYTNLENKDAFYQSFWTQEVLVTMDKVNWTLTQDTKKIGQYTCYKATANIDSEQTFGMNFLSPIVAWYTPEIPVSFGIQTFNGLPGLTLELTTSFSYGTIHYIATKIELNPKKEIKIKKPKGKRYITETQYVELQKRMNGGRK